jgi:hypothetical protein
MRTCIFVVTVVLSITTTSCIGYESEEPEQQAWDPLYIAEIQELPDALVGRLWVSPNPIVFGVDLQGYQISEFFIDIANIGSEKAVITDITMSGDPDFDFYDKRPNEGRFPTEIGGDADCNGHSGMGFPIVYAEVTDDNASATMVVHTSDPTSPAVKVPIYKDVDIVYEDHYMESIESAKPVVKPNPIRIDRDKVKTGHEIEVCLSLHYGGERLFRFTKVEAFSDSVRIEELRDYHGNPVTLPVPYDQWTADPCTAVLSYNPQQDKAEDGALVVHFEKDSGRQQALVVPIIVR